MPNPAARGERESQVKLDICFPADQNRIAAIVEQVSAVSRDLHGETDACQELALALTEALANAVKHGCKNDPAQSVQLRVTAADRAIQVMVRDPGPGFDPGSVANPLETAGLSADHGRGLFMIRQLVDEVRFERNGAEIWMVKRF